MFKRNLTLLLLVAALAAGLIAAGLAFARSVELEEPMLAVDAEQSRDVPMTIWFQGFLADGTTGDPITASYEVVARIYDQAAGGSLIWGPEAHAGTTITEGWLNIELGATVALPDFGNPPYYLALTIDGEVLEPRLKLGSVPSALRTATVDVLLPFGELVNTSSTAFMVAQNGTGPAGWFDKDNPGGGPALLGVHSGAGPGVEARSSGTGPALFAHAEGAGIAGEFLGDVEVDGTVVAVSSDTFAGDFYSDCVLGSGEVSVLRSRYTGPDGQDAAGIWAQATPDDAWGFGGVFDGSLAGVWGRVDVLPINGGGFGVWGVCTGGEGTSVNTGVYGLASDGADNYGVVGEAGGGPRQDNYAGYFLGDVYAEGYHGPVAFMKIDHPVDPANRYLAHAFVASDDLKTVYDGVVVLDGSGSAWVELPDWFEALNGDFRYQLTPIGSPAPNLHIASPIAGNRFAIGGGEPGMEVCWQVTGIRRDAVAEARRAPVESAKPGDKRGKYLHPEAFGLPASMATDYSEGRERAKEILREKFRKGR